MGINEQEVLARQLWAIFREALGDMAHTLAWEDMQPRQREAWIQVAQFVESLTPPQVVVFNDLQADDVAKAVEQYKNQWHNKKPMVATDTAGWQFSHYEGICPDCLRIIETPDHK